MPRRKRASPQKHPIGCGIDVVDVAQFRQTVKRRGAAFLRRVFTAQERKYATRQRFAILHLSARFAAKEAVIKAMAQIDPAHVFAFQQIEIVNDPLGRPSVVLHGMPTRSPTVHVSLTHAKSVAAACAVVIR